MKLYLFGDSLVDSAPFATPSMVASLTLLLAGRGVGPAGAGSSRVQLEDYSRDGSTILTTAGSIAKSGVLERLGDGDVLLFSCGGNDLLHQFGLTLFADRLRGYQDGQFEDYVDGAIVPRWEELARTLDQPMLHEKRVLLAVVNLYALDFPEEELRREVDGAVNYYNQRLTETFTAFAHASPSCELHVVDVNAVFKAAEASGLSRKTHPLFVKTIEPSVHGSLLIAQAIQETLLAWLGREDTP